MIKKTSFLLLVLLGCVMSLMTAQTSHPIEILVHRGANHLAPENTVPSALAALEQGAKWIELDVRQSKDGVLYNLHDETLERTTNGTGKIGDATAAQINQLDCGSWFSLDFAGLRVPTIAQMLDTLKGKAPVFFDVKNGTDLPKLIALVKEKGYEQNSFFWFGDDSMLREFIRLAPQLKIKVNASDIATLQRWMKICRPAYVEIEPKDITQEFKQFCHEHQIKVMAAIQGSDEQAYNEAIEKQPDLVNLDRPELFTRLLRKQRVSLTRQPVQIAFIADAHVSAVVDQPHLLKSLEAETHSTRLFNENYMALVAALDDVVKRGIKLVVMPGDLTDNGQLINLQTAQKLLQTYSREHGLSFFVTTGNHDPSRPFRTHYIGNEFLNQDGKIVTVASNEAILKEKATNAIRMVDGMIANGGYEEELWAFGGFGLKPHPQYDYWATPFSSYTYDTYDERQALEESKLIYRSYQLKGGLPSFDVSYVVEPVDGLWLLSIDGSVHAPVADASGKQHYSGSGTGYEEVMKHKEFLIQWIGQVCAEAKRRGKTLITFSHYPLLDYNNGASELIKKSWGAGKFDLSRVPSPEVSQQLLEAGVRIHVAGHMHLNNTNRLKGKDGQHLYNIQLPSIAFNVPAYKILTVDKDKRVDVQTVTLDQVKGFDRFFETYAKEQRENPGATWSDTLLTAKNYAEFCQMHFRELCRLRFIPNDIPSLLRQELVPMKGSDILALTGLRDMDASWTGFDFLCDLYRLHYAGELGLKQIPTKRLGQYKTLFSRLGRLPHTAFAEQLRQTCHIFERFLDVQPSINFTIDLKTDTLTVR